MKSKPILPVGTRIFNGGDMANLEHFGTIIKVETDRWGTHYYIKVDDEDREYNIPACAISPEYKGHGGTRIVTIDAYNKYRRAEFAKIGITEFEDAK